METKIFTDDLTEAAQLLRGGKLVAVPTETVYGLAGNGLDENAVNEIYEVKGRPAVKPLSLMVSCTEAMDLYCEDIPDAAKFLAKKFWPGPLTIVLKAKKVVPEIVRAGGTTVGLRCPDHPMTLKLLDLSGIPFAAPSANPSGEDSPKDANQVLRYFDGKISAIVDGGPCGIGTESTLLDMSCTPYRVLRQGALSAKDIGAALLERMKIIGLTGPSGSGKTTALKELEAMGAMVIDCDELYHSILNTRSDLLLEIGDAFPGMIKDGVLDRRALAMIVFSDFTALDRLKAITHKYIVLEVKDKLEQWTLKGGELAAIDAVELISSGLSDICTASIAVLADEKIRLERIMKRDGISLEDAELRIEAQKDDQYYRENCSFVLENNGDDLEFKNNLSLIILEVNKNGRS